jgi:hypothetical protein
VIDDLTIWWDGKTLAPFYRAQQRGSIRLRVSGTLRCAFQTKSIKLPVNQLLRVPKKASEAQVYINVQSVESLSISVLLTTFFSISGRRTKSH